MHYKVASEIIFNTNTTKSLFMECPGQFYKTDSSYYQNHKFQRKKIYKIKLMKWPL